MDTDGREEARFLLWSQVHHGRPISGGLGQQLRGHEPAGFAEWRDGLRLFQMLRTVGAGGAVSDGLQPEDVQALVDAGFTDVVVDAAAFPAPLAAAIVGAHACVLRSVFGEPAYEGAAGARWAVAVPEAPVAVRCAYDASVRGRTRRVR